MTVANQTTLPYDMGNAGDLLKHGVLAEFLRTRLIFQRDQPIRFLDLFAGEPVRSGTCDGIIKRVDKLSGCALKEAQPDIQSKQYYGSGMLARKLCDSLGGHVSVIVSDCDSERREKLQESGLVMLEDELPHLGNPHGYDAYAALEMIQNETTNEDLILIDPFADFLKPEPNGHNRAEKILPIVSEISKHSAVLLFVLNKNPFNSVGRRFDELLYTHLQGGLILTCPPIHGTDIKIKGESKYYADVVLATPTAPRNCSEFVYFRSRLKFFARKLANAVGLSERGHMMLKPRIIGADRLVL